MTQKEMAEKIREVGCTVRVRDGEIRVNLRGSNEAGAYYTNDRDDAVATAREMAEARMVKVFVLPGPTFRGVQRFEEVAYDVSVRFAEYLRGLGIARLA